MPWFSLGRVESFPSNYGEQLTPANTDVLVAGFILAFVILALACIAILPAYSTGWRWAILSAYLAVSLSMGGILLVCNFGANWETGHATITSPYKPASMEELVGDIGLHISLRGVNITLKGALKRPDTARLTHEVIYYNEHYSWEWAQGRFGFGPYAGRISREYRDSITRGTPLPILGIAEYFTFDGEGLRFGRHYRLAGFYAHFFMWLAFCNWVLANVALLMVVRLGAFCLTATGFSQLIAILLWSNIRNSIELQIPFEAGDGKAEALLVTKYGTDFWLVMVNGVVCTVGGLALLVLDDFYMEKMCKVFGIDPLSVYIYEYTAETHPEQLRVSNLSEFESSVGTSTQQPTTLNLHMIHEAEEENQDDDEDDEGQNRPDSTISNSSAVTVIRRRRPRPSSEASTSPPAIVIVRRRRTKGGSIYNVITRRSVAVAAAARSPTTTTTGRFSDRLPTATMLESNNGKENMNEVNGPVILNLILEDESARASMNGRRLTSSEI